MNTAEIRDFNSLPVWVIEGLFPMFNLIRTKRLIQLAHINVLSLLVYQMASRDACIVFANNFLRNWFLWTIQQLKKVKLRESGQKLMFVKSTVVVAGGGGGGSDYHKTFTITVFQI